MASFPGRTAMPNLVNRTSSVGRLDVLTHEPALAELAESDGKTDCQMQKAFRLHVDAEKPFGRLVVRVLEHQYGLAGVAS